MNKKNYCKHILCIENKLTDEYKNMCMKRMGLKQCSYSEKEMQKCSMYEKADIKIAECEVNE